MLKIKNLRKQYHDFSLHCSMEVRPGCITDLVGRNGAGKSTTLKAALFSISYLTFVCSFFIISSITYDEYENGFRFLFTLPIMRNTYVRSKYVFAVLLCMVSWLTDCLHSQHGFL